MNKKYVILIFSIIIFLIIIAFFLNLVNKSSWNNFSINDFKISSMKDTWTNYPASSDITDQNKVISFIPFLEGRINQIKKYSWFDDSREYATIIIIELKQNDYFNYSSQIKPLPFALNKEKILDEEVFSFTTSINYNGEPTNLKTYIWDEDKFIFITSGAYNFPEAIVEKVIKKYPQIPTGSKLDPYSIQLNNISYLPVSF